jgi:hypothetical protein
VADGDLEKLFEAVKGCGFTVATSRKIALQPIDLEDMTVRFRRDGVQIKGSYTRKVPVYLLTLVETKELEVRSNV